MKQIINTKNAPAAIGPYSQGVAVECGNGKMIFLSGQIALDPTTGSLAGSSIEEQTKQVMTNIAALLSETGAHFENIVKSTIFLKNFDHFSTVNEIYGSYFPKDPPARSTVEVARLPKDALLEIECIVVL